MKQRIILYADEGMILTDGEIYGKQIYLADNAEANDYYEISEAEYEKILKEESEEMGEL